MPMNEKHKLLVTREDSLLVLNLDTRARNALFRARIRTFADLLTLLDMGENALYRVRNMGDKGVAEVREALKRVEIANEPDEAAEATPLVQTVNVYVDKEGRISPDAPLAALDLGVRVYNALRRYGIDTVGSLLSLRDSGEDNFYQVRNLGIKGVLEINRALERFEIADIKSIPSQLPARTKIQVVHVIGPEVIAWQREFILRQIRAGTLHREALYRGQTTGHWLAVAGEEPPDRIFLTFSNIIGCHLTICDELEALIRGQLQRGRNPWRDFHILVERFRPTARLTLQQLADELNLSRERVRQLQVQTTNTLLNAVSVDGATLRIQSALLRARDTGRELSLTGWREDLITSGMCGRWQNDALAHHDPLNLVLALCLALERHETALTIPGNLKLAIQLGREGRPDVAVNDLIYEQSVSSDARRLIRRHLQHSGAVNALWLQEKLDDSHPAVVKLLHSLKFKWVEGNWYWLPDRKENSHANSKDEVFHRTIRKMLVFCGPLDVDSLQNGLRVALTRQGFPAPSSQVLDMLLHAYGYPQADERFLVPEDVQGTLSDSEKIIISCIRSNGPVISFSKLCQAFDQSLLSRAALVARLQNSPLFEKIATGLYILRGATFSPADIQRAREPGRRKMFKPDNTLPLRF